MKYPHVDQLPSYLLTRAKTNNGIFSHLCGMTFEFCSPGPSTVSSQCVRAHGSGLVNDMSAFTFCPTLPVDGAWLYIKKIRVYVFLE
jgi:hypothetical protein